MAQARANEERELTSREIVFREIDRLGLGQNILELEEQGYTIVEDALPRDMVVQKAKALKSRFD